MTDTPQRAATAAARAERADRLPPRQSPAEVLRDIERVIAKDTRKQRAKLAAERMARRAAK